MKIYHNPRCSKSRLTLALIQESGQEVEIIEYLKESLSFKDLKSILEMLNIKAIELIRTNEIIWKENYKGKEMTDQELINAMRENPKLGLLFGSYYVIIEDQLGCRVVDSVFICTTIRTINMLYISGVNQN